MDVLIATKNKGKVKEFAHMFSYLNINFKSLVDIDDQSEVDEDGTTFEMNAIKKATFYCEKYNLPVLGDDSGLEVDALNGEPGIYSARYAGVHGDDEANNQKLLSNLQNIEKSKRTARFVCALALKLPNQDSVVVRGELEGLINDQMIGDNGFGYDPLFYLPELEKTAAQLTKAEKSKISHRGQAMRKIAPILEEKIAKNISR